MKICRNVISFWLVNGISRSWIIPSCSKVEKKSLNESTRVLNTSWGFRSHGATPMAEWFFMEHPLKTDDLGYRYFGNLYITFTLYNQVRLPLKHCDLIAYELDTMERTTTSYYIQFECA